MLGFAVKVISGSFNIQTANLAPVLSILGTIGLILIVLEGSLELEANKQKLPLIAKSSIVALIPLLAISFGIAYYLHTTELVPLKKALANAIPLAIISSAIAIPSARHLLNRQKEFITYESSLSDIFGVIFFNFITLNDNIGTSSFGKFSIEMLLMLVISFIATLLLAGFLNRIKHHIKFIPIIIFVVLIYAISKLFHLPGLIFILIFGLFLGNIDELRHISFIQKFHPVNFSKDVHRFREITTELAFLVRALFFILFGFLIETNEVLNVTTIYLALAITGSIFLLRIITLAIFRVPIMPILFIAPRGLITILLFLSIPASLQIPLINKSLVIQIIILTAMVIMFGLIGYKKPVEETDKT